MILINYANAFLNTDIITESRCQEWLICSHFSKLQLVALWGLDFTSWVIVLSRNLSGYFLGGGSDELF